MLKTAKQGVLKAAKRAGVFRSMGGSKWRSDRLLILGYHGVSLGDEHIWDAELFLAPDVLRRRFELIVKLGYRVLPLGEAVERLYAGSLPPKALALTFDDGFYNFYAKAFPVLEEFEFPATVYLTTFYSAFNRPVFGIALNYVLWKNRSGKLNLASLTGDGAEIDLSVPDGTRRAHAALVAYTETEHLSAEEKDRLLEKVCDQLRFDYAKFCESRFFQLMNGNEVEEISKAGIDVQMHTHRHRVPPTEDLFVREIADNRSAIAALTRKTPTHFCYPSGEYRPTFFPWLEAGNVLTATTCEPAMTTRKTPALVIPRLIDTNSLTDLEFEGWLSGFSSMLPRRNGHRR